MGNDLDPLILDMIEWIAREPRTYVDLIDAWRTSCPRLTVWEDAVDRGHVTRERSSSGVNCVVVSDTGMALLRERRPWLLTLTDDASSHPAVQGNGLWRPRA
jgi:hypothetical protein